MAAGKTCSVCGLFRPTQYYTRYSYVDEGGHKRFKYRDVCSTCRTAEKNKKLKSQVAERVVKRKETQERKQLGRMGQTLKKTVRSLSIERARELVKQYADQPPTAYMDIVRYRAAKARLRGINDETCMTPAEREYIQRLLIKRKLLPFVRKFNKNYIPGWVHKDICQRLERFVRAIEQQKSPRLMIFMPPRHGKSEIASKNFPAWVLGHHPDWEIIASSYAVSLPVGFSRKVQGTLQDPYYQNLFPETRIHPKAQAADAWMTAKHEGGYIAAGVGTGISGKGAHILIIDDPVKDAEEADSETQREKVWDWWGSTAKTRLAPGGGVLIIQTRWHDDDLSGRLLSQQAELEKEFNTLIAEAEQDNKPELVALYQKQKEEEIDQWEVISYPAIAKHDEFLNVDTGKISTEKPDEELMGQVIQVRSDGEALHPDRFPEHRLMNMKRTLQPRHWSALYQQDPVPDEGAYFTKDMLRYTAPGSTPPRSQLKIFIAWDLAVGKSDTNDYTVGAAGGLDWQGNIHILDIVRFRGDTHMIAEAVLATYKRFPTAQQIGIERGQLELAVWPQLKLLMKKQKIYPVFNHDLRPITDKLVRARPLQGRMQQGTVVLPPNTNWTEKVEHELLRFPGGAHDDIVDAMAWLIRMMSGVSEPPKPGVGKNSSWKDKLRKIEAQQRGRNNRGHMVA